MKVGEQDLLRFEEPTLLWLGLLDLDDHVRIVKHLFCGIHHDCAGGPVQLIREADLGTCARLDQNLMARGFKFSDARWRHPDPKLLRFDLCWYSDQHGFASQFSGAHCRVTRSAAKGDKALRCPL